MAENTVKVLLEAPNMVNVPLGVSTRKGDGAKTEFTTPLPKDLASAILHEGSEKEVLRYYIKAKVVELQAEQRNKLQPEGEKKERKKAAYLEELGF